MPLEGVYIFPHGALTLNPLQYPYYKGLEEINKSCFEISNEIYSKNPETIFFITPHGISLENSFGIYLNSKGQGNAEWKDSYKNYSFECNIDTEISQKLLYFLIKTNNNIDGIVSYAEDEVIPLRWAEVIPLWFINQAYLNNSLESKKYPKLVFISLPRRRNLLNNLNIQDLSEDGNIFYSECLQFGKNIGQFLNEYNKRYIFIISGDLSHKHLYPPVISKNLQEIKIDNADLLDLSISDWISDPIKNEKILKKSLDFQKKFLSCGYFGFVILQGLLYEFEEIFKEIKGEVLCNCHPTYYGMMVAKLILSNFEDFVVVKEFKNKIY